jgi:hypothetical protein
VVGRDARHQRLGDEREGVEAGRRRPGRPDECQVERAGVHLVDQVVGGALDQRHLDARVGAVEPGQGVEQAGDRAGGDHAHGQPAPEEGVHVVHRLADGVGRGQRRPGVREHRLARRREGHGAAGPVEQLGPQLAFELADLGADPRLADVGPLGRPGEVGLLGDRHHVGQLAKVHDHRF